MRAATARSKYVQISQGGKLIATVIAWALVMALQGFKAERNRKPNSNSYLTLNSFDLYSWRYSSPKRQK